MADLSADPAAQVRLLNGIEMAGSSPPLNYFKKRFLTRLERGLHNQISGTDFSLWDLLPLDETTA
jgi:hypothetical protein